MADKVVHEHTIKVVLAQRGTIFVFKRPAKNQFGEPDKSKPQLEISICGIYHEQNGYITLTENTASRTVSKPVPMVLTLWKDYQASPLLLGDVLTYNGRDYSVTGVTNVQQSNIVADISLELVK